MRTNLARAAEEPTSATEPSPPLTRGAVALRKALVKKGWTQRDLARRLGVSPPTITRWLSGERVPDRVNMGKLRKLLGLNPAIWVS